ncbi:MAG: HD domain-containing protein [Patescibacteria group bacterium]
MKLPSRNECQKIFNKYHTPVHIIKHSLAVNKVANYLAKKLVIAGCKINLDLVDRASLLHDTIRVADIKGDLFAYTDKSDETKTNLLFWQKLQKKFHNQHHAEASYQIFKKQYLEMARVIKKHRLSAILRGELKTWEEKIVYYADKRVDHDKFVSIKKRLSQGRKRWHSVPNTLDNQELLKQLTALEKQIFSAIKVKPQKINDL